jgi:outer membrane receptor protein involved in Fe transport
LVVLLLGSAAAFGGSTAFAAASAADAVSADNEIQEIVVTARKREERLLEVPAPISVVTQQTLQRTQSVRLEDYLTLVPGVTFNTARAGQTSLSFRGINNGGSNATVVTYVNDTPFTSSSTYANGAFVTPDLDPADIAQIEVLRGPQGTLYGANAVGGVLRYVTVKPDPNAFSGRLEIGGESVFHGGLGAVVRGVVNVPLITDKLAVKLSAFSRDDAGYVDVPRLNQKDVNEAHISGGRAELLYTPTDKVSLDISAMTQQTTSHGIEAVNYNPFTGKPTIGDLQSIVYLADPYFHAKYGIYNAALKVDLGWANLLSSTSYSTQLNGGDGDATSQYGPLLSAALGRPNTGLDNPLIVHQNKVTEELRLSSKDSDTFEWQVGAFYTVERSKYDQAANLFDTNTQAYVTSFGDIFLVTLKAQYKEYSLFGNFDYHFTDKFDVGLGIRYGKSDQKFHEFATGLLIGPPQDFDNPASADVVTWLINPRYKLNEDQMVYGRIATGYRPGGGNALAASTIAAGAAKAFQADTLTNYEIGWKAALFDRAVTADVSLYYISWTDMQLPVSLANIHFQGNGGRAHSQGVEAAVSWKPTSHLTLSANLAYNANKLESDKQSDVALSQAGYRLPSTPRVEGGFDIDYHWDMANDVRAFVGGSLYATTDRPNTFQVGYSPTGASGAGSFTNFGLTPIYDENTGAQIGLANTKLPGYTMINLRAGADSGPWTFEAYVKNLTDVRTVSQYGGVNSPNGSNLSTDWQAIVGRPRTIGFSLARKF